LGEVRDFGPRRDAADPRDVDLYDRARARLQIILELARAVERLADGYRDRAVPRELSMPRDVVGGQRLLEPGDVERFEMPRAADRFGQSEALIGVGHDVPVRAYAFANGAQPLDILGDVRAADFYFRAAEAPGLRLQGVVDERSGRQVQPAAFGGVERTRILRAAGEHGERQPGAPAAQIPERCVERGERERGYRADRGRMRVEKEVAPDRLDVLRVAADRQRREMIGEERHDRRASGADRIAVTGSGRAVAVEDAHDRRLLRDEALDRVGALDLGLEV